MMNTMNQMFNRMHGRSRAITAENPHGLKGEGGKAESPLGLARKGKAFISLAQGETATLVDIEGPGIIQHIWMTVADMTESGWFVLRDLVLRMYWDDEATPSVEVPLGDFFCNGFGARAIINSMPIVVNPVGGMNCYFPMPFRKAAKVTITNEHPQAIEAFFYQLDYLLMDELGDDVEYFHAQYRRENPTVMKKDFTLIEGIKGRGKFVGCYMAWTSLSRYWWGEGEVKFYIDGDGDWPTICGTGAEDYFGGAWGFVKSDNGNPVQEQTYSTPFLGFPYFSKTDDTRAHIYDGATCPMRGFYRWHLPDPILFEEDLRITVQQIGHDGKALFERSDDIAAVSYWYQTEPHQAFPSFPDVLDRRPR